MRFVNYTMIFFFFVCIDLAITFVTFTNPEMNQLLVKSTGIDLNDLTSSYAEMSNYLTNGTLASLDGFMASALLTWKTLVFTVSLMVKMPFIVATVFSYFGLPPVIATIFLTLNTIVFAMFFADVIRKIRGISMG